jgi:hypothetical protein
MIAVEQNVKKSAGGGKVSSVLIGLGRFDQVNTISVPSTIFSSLTCIIGKSGSGTTTTAAMLVEQATAAGHKVLVIDTQDSWWSLRLRCDRKFGGLPIPVIGGANGDRAISIGSGRIVADMVVDHGQSLVVSLNEMRPPDKTRFVLDTVRRLSQRTAQETNGVLVVIDAASELTHTRTKISQVFMQALELLSGNGAHPGLGFILINPRLRKEQGGLLSHTDLLFVHRCDDSPLDEWLETHGTGQKVPADLPASASLANGQAIVVHSQSTTPIPVLMAGRSTYDPKSQNQGGVPDRSLWAPIAREELFRTWNRMGVILADEQRRAVIASAIRGVRVGPIAHANGISRNRVKLILAGLAQEEWPLMAEKLPAFQAVNKMNRQAAAVAERILKLKQLSATVSRLAMPQPHALMPGRQMSPAGVHGEPPKRRPGRPRKIRF